MPLVLHLWIVGEQVADQIVLDDDSRRVVVELEPVGSPVVAVQPADDAGTTRRHDQNRSSAGSRLIAGALYCTVYNFGAEYAGFVFLPSPLYCTASRPPTLNS